MLLLLPHRPWWFGSYEKAKMVDLMSMEGWLPDASLFFDEPADSTNINDFFSSEKANSKEGQAVLDSSHAGWYDEKIDFSALDNPNSLLDHHNETDMWMPDESTNILGLLGDGIDLSFINTSDIFKNEGIINFTEELDFQNIAAEPASSEILDSHLASPTCNTLQVNSPAFFPAQSPASPYSDISDAEESSSSFAVQSPESSFVTSDYTNNSVDLPQIQILTNASVGSSSAFELEEASHAVKRKSEDGGETKRKIFKVMFPEDVRESSNRRTKGVKDKQERKKVQNKEAAARYRVKKRMEEKVLSDEVDELESKQEKLQKKHDELQSEINYLKSLMCEILTKKGIMK